MGAQREPGAVRPLRQVEGVVLLSRRVLGRDVEGGKVVEIFLDMRPLGERETHLAEDRDDLVDCLTDRMDAPCTGERHRERNVGALGGEPLFEYGAAESRRRLCKCVVDPVLDDIQRCADLPPLFGFEPGELSHRQGQRPAATENLDADCFERLRGGRGRDFLCHLVEVFHEQILQQKRADRCGPSRLNAGTPRISDCTRR